MKKLSNEEQIKWQKAVIRDEMDELQEQWEKAITEDWRVKPVERADTTDKE